jgi:hypothetical protein
MVRFTTTILAPRCRTGAIHPIIDHLICSGQYHLRNGKAEGVRSPEIDHELELADLHDWQVGGFGTFRTFPA